MDYVQEIREEADQSIVQFALLLDGILALIALVSIVAIWNRKKWGYQGLLIVYGLTLLLSICSANIATIVINGGIMFLVYKVIGNIDHLLE